MKETVVHTGVHLRTTANRKGVWRGVLVALVIAVSSTVGQETAGQTSTVRLEEDRPTEVKRTWEARHVSPKAEKAGYFGSAIEVVEDVTGDGTSELLVGAPRESPNGPVKSGQVHLLNGIGGLPLRSIRSPASEKNGRFGSSLAQVPDLNDDGQKEMVIGAPGEGVRSVEGAGKVYLLNGENGNVLRELTSPHPAAHGRFGASVAVLETPTSSGTNVGNPVKIAIGAPGEKVETSHGSSTDTLRGAGRVYRFALQRGGRDGGNIQPVSTGTIESPRPETNGHFGVSLAAGRLGQDAGGLRLMIGADESPGGVGNAGRVYVTGPDGEIVQGRLRSPDPVQNGRFGASVSSVPDMDGDGGRELLVGAPVEASMEGEKDGGGGMVYLVDGSSKEVMRRFALPEANRNSFFGMATGKKVDRDGDEERRWPHLEILVGSAEEHREKRSAGVIYRFDL